MPEQVWDEADKPERDMRRGQPDGSAVPLVWAHAEYLKLLRSALDGKVFDRIDPVYERYCTPEGRARCGHGLEIYTKRRPIQRMDAGRTLRILDDAHFEVVWTDDGWQTQHTTASRAVGQRGIQRRYYARDWKRGSGVDPALAGGGRLAWIQCEGQD